MSGNLEIGERLEILRRARGWRQAQVAESMTAAGIKWHTSTTSKVEKGERTLRPDELVRLGLIFGVTVDEILSGLRPEDPTALLRQVEWQVWHGKVLIALAEAVTVLNAMPTDCPDDAKFSEGVARLARELTPVLASIAGGGR